MRAVILLLLSFSKFAIAGFEGTGNGARPRGFGRAFVGLADDVWAIFYNVGGLARLKSGQLSFTYSPQPFGLSELSTVAAAISYPTTVGVFGFAGRKYGYELYREITGTLSYANTISGIHFGLGFNYHAVAIRRYGSAGTIGIDVGMLIPILDQLRWGLSIKNINSPHIGEAKENLSKIFLLGLAFVPNNHFNLLIDLQKEMKFDLSPKFGFEYWIVDGFALRGGVSDEPTEYSGGLGIRYALFQIDYAFSSHQELGMTHEASISISWGGSNE